MYCTAVHAAVQGVMPYCEEAEDVDSLVSSDHWSVLLFISVVEL